MEDVFNQSVVCMFELKVSKGGKFKVRDQDKCK